MDAGQSRGAEPDDSKGQVGNAVIVLKEAKDEGRRILTDEQYWYVVGIERRLTEFGDKKAMSDLRISQFGNFWALKLKGGMLKRINLRIYFSHQPKLREVIVLKTYKKEDDRRVYPGLEDTLEDRLEDYLAGKNERVSVHRRIVRDDE